MFTAVPGLAPDEPEPEPEPGREAFEVVVEGERWLVRPVPGRPGHTHYDWLSHHTGYGFGSSRSDRVDPTYDEHVEAIRDFLDQVDPETGYLD